MEPLTQDWQVIAERLEKLETQNRRVKQFVLVLLVLVFSFVLMGQAPKKPTVERTVEANEFILRGPDGAMRAALYISENQPALTLYDGNGKGRAALSLSPQSEPQLVLVNPKPKNASRNPWAAMSQVTANGFSMEDSDNLRARMLLGTSGDPVLVLLGPDGKTRAELSMLEGEPGLALYDVNGKSRASLAVSPQYGPGLWLFSANPKAGSGSQVTADGFSLYHQENIRAALLVAADGTPGLAFNDAKGNPISFAPPSPPAQREAERDARPRVFVEAWADFSEALHRVGGQRKDQPLDEIAAMTQSCPQAVVTVERQKADYILVFQQEYSSEPSRAHYQYVASHSGGAVLGTGANAQLSGAAGEACTAIMRDWSSKAR